jgi:hypothetical protein
MARPVPDTKAHPKQPPAPPPDARTQAALAATERLVPDYRPFGWPRRVLILALAVGTAMFIVWAMTRPPGKAPDAWFNFQPVRPAAPPVPTCAPGQTQGCVGGTMQVLPAAAPTAPPTATAASAAR